ncbi:MAG: POT family MFS transporter [Deltaproteobacteria bacterium]|nr:MAG: POT family MFS transporter [Deltaproteobacteria bacterium]
MTTVVAAEVSTSLERMPPQIPFIIANEGCERFSFYGMRNILTAFLTGTLLTHLPMVERKIAATEVFHTFVIGVYFFPLLGGWLSDRFFGKYRTILWFSLVYCAGQGCLAAFSYNRTGFYFGLGLIAFGSGGIKPLVASFMGDQLDSRTKHLAKLMFDAFYWIINFGSLLATATMATFLDVFGPRIAFGIPGVLMLISTIVLYLGRRRYVMVPPAPPNPNSFLRVVRTALVTRVPGRGRPGLALAGLGAVLACGAIALLVLDMLDLVPAVCLALVVLAGFGGAGATLQLDRARVRHPDEAVDGVRAVLRVLILFALITPFWSLFDQKASTWVLQADGMSKPPWFKPSHMLALNPALVMILIPFNNLVVFPWMRRRGWEPTALRRMTTGIALTGLSWVIVAIMQLRLDAGTQFSIVWQVAPYVVLTLGEVLVSATGLEFAYSQAPPAMKGTLMSFFNLTVAIGSLWVLLANASIKRPAVTDWIAQTGLTTTAFYMFFFAVFAFAAALAFGLYARHYREVDHYRV